MYLTRRTKKKIIIIASSVGAALIVALVLILCLGGRGKGGGSDNTEPHIHSFGEWTVDKEATCAEEGSEVRVCSCGESESQSIQMTEHDFVWVTDKEPTVQTIGIKHEECKECHATKNLNTSIEKLPHTHQMIKTEYEEFSCIKDGVREHYTCTLCNDTFSDAEGEIKVNKDDMYVKADWHSFENNVCVNCHKTYEECFAAGISYRLSDDGTYYSVISANNCVAEEIVIPPTFNGLPVKTVEQYAFLENNHAKKIILPPSVTDIGLGAFGNCVNLESIELSKSLISIGDSAFVQCKSLKNITIPDSVTSMGKNMFSGCLSLSVAVIGNGVEVIPEYTFNNCKSLVSVTIGASVTEISDEAFGECIRLVEIINRSAIDIKKENKDYEYLTNYALTIHRGLGKTVTDGDFVFLNTDGVWYMVNYLGEDPTLILPEAINGEKYVINQNTFYSNAKLTSVVVSSGVKAINKNAFYSCIKLAEVVNKSALNIMIGSSDNGSVAKYALTVHKAECTVIEQDGFCFIKNGANYYLIAYTGNESEIVLPDHINNMKYIINDYAFSDNDILTSVKLSDGVTRIMYNVFANCKKLKKIEISKSVSVIDNGAIGYCPALTEISVDTRNTKYKSIDGNLYDINGVNLIQYAIGKTDTQFVVPKSVEKIFEYAFYYCQGLESVVIHTNVSTIERSAFYLCSNLKRVYFESDMEDWNAIEIGENNFLKSDVYFYSEHEPMESGYYWHYNANGKVTRW